MIKLDFFQIWRNSGARISRFPVRIFDRVVETAFYASRGTFEESYFWQKLSIFYKSQTSSETIRNFGKKFRKGCQNSILHAPKNWSFSVFFWNSTVILSDFENIWWTWSWYMLSAVLENHIGDNFSWNMEFLKVSSLLAGCFICLQLVQKENLEKLIFVIRTYFIRFFQTSGKETPFFGKNYRHWFQRCILILSMKILTKSIQISKNIKFYYLISSENLLVVWATSFRQKFRNCILSGQNEKLRKTIFLISLYFCGFVGFLEKKFQFSAKTIGIDVKTEFYVPRETIWGKIFYEKNLFFFKNPFWRFFFERILRTSWVLRLSKNKRIEFF